MIPIIVITINTIIQIMCFIFYFVYFIGHVTYANYYMKLRVYNNYIMAFFTILVCLYGFSFFAATGEHKNNNISFYLEYSYLCSIFYIIGVIVLAFLGMAQLYFTTREYFKHKRGIE